MFTVFVTEEGTVKYAYVHMRHIYDDSVVGSRFQVACDNIDAPLLCLDETSDLYCSFRVRL